MSRRMRLLVLLASGAACACAGSGAPQAKQGPATDQRPPLAANEAAPSAAAATNREARAPSALQVSLTGEVESEGGVEAVVQNHDAAPVRLAPDVAVERESGGRFAPFAERALSLRFACDAPPAACLELVPGAELRPPRWLRTAGRSQCNEREALPAPPGRYRFVARTCDGARIEGALFDLR